MDQFNYDRACSISPGDPDSSSSRCITGIVRKNGGSCSSGSGSSTDASTDEDSELEYGPGIVAKLKSKFLRYSMSKTDSRTGRSGMQQSSVYGRAHKLKRCSSLENIVEPASSCCVERHRIDILDHKDLLRVSTASAPAAPRPPDEEISANVTKIEYAAVVTKGENEASVLSNGVRLLNQRNLNGNMRTTTTTTTSTPAAKPTTPVIRNYCLKSSPPLSAGNSTAAVIAAPDHRDNNLPSATASIVSGRSVTSQSTCANQMTNGVTAAVVTSRANPFLKQYVSSCVAAAGAAPGITSNPSQLVAGNGRPGRSEPVPAVKETDPLTNGREIAASGTSSIVTQQQQVPRVTARRFQSNCKSKAKSNKHPLPPQHYHVYGSSVVKRAKSMESLLFDAESRILPDDNDEEEDDGTDAGEGDREEGEGGNSRVLGQVPQHEAAVASHEQHHDVVAQKHDRQVQDQGKKLGNSSDQVQAQPPAALPTSAATAVPARRPLPPVPHPSPRHPPPSVPPPPPPPAQSSSESSAPSSPSPSSSFSADGLSIATVVRAGGSSNSRVAIVPPIVHETSAAEETDCRSEKLVAGRSPPHHWLPLHQQTTADDNHNFVTPSPDLLAASSPSSSTCSESIARAASSSSLPSDCLPGSEKGSAGTGDQATAAIPPKAPARSSLLHKKQQQSAQKSSSGSQDQDQDEGAVGGEGVKVQQSSDKSFGSTSEAGGGNQQPLSAATLLPAPQSHEQRTTAAAAESGSVAVKRSLVRGSSLPPVKPMIAQKPKSLKVNPLDHLKAAVSSPTSSTTKTTTPAPAISPFLFTPSLIPAVGKQAAASGSKPQVIERQSFVKDKASGTSSSTSPPAEQRMLTPSNATTAPAALSDSSAALSATTAAAAAVVPSLPPIASPSSSLPSSGVTEKLPKSSPSPCSAAASAPAAPAADTSSTQSLNPFANSSSDILKALLDLHEQKPSMIISSGQSSTNCMIFDFRGKNVKPQLAITSPFGRAAVIQATTESDADGDKDSPDSPDLSPTLIFLGENEIIGNGSLLKIRNKKLRIHFNENSLTSTYEYPSESSLCHQFDDRNQANADAAADACAFSGGEVSDRLVQEKDQETGAKTETLIKPANSDEASSWSASSAASDLLF